MVNKEYVRRVLAYLLSQRSVAANLSLEEVGKAISELPATILYSVGWAIDKKLIDGDPGKVVTDSVTIYNVKRIDGITEKGKKWLDETP